MQHSTDCSEIIVGPDPRPRGQVVERQEFWDEVEICRARWLGSTEQGSSWKKDYDLLWYEDDAGGNRVYRIARKYFYRC